MAWKRRSTTVNVNAEVELSDVDKDSLLQALVDANYITKEEAEAISNRATKKSPFHIEDVFLADELERARFYARIGRKSDALHHVENYLGRDWIGLLS